MLVLNFVFSKVICSATFSTNSFERLLCSLLKIFPLLFYGSDYLVLTGSCRREVSAVSKRYLTHPSRMEERRSRIWPRNINRWKKHIWRTFIFRPSAVKIRETMKTNFSRYHISFKFIFYLRCLARHHRRFYIIHEMNIKFRIELFDSYCR